MRLESGSPRDRRCPRRVDGALGVRTGAPVVGVVMADHQQAFAEGLTIILDAQDGLSVLGVAHDTPRVVRLAIDHRPAVLLLDASLPGGDLSRTPATVRAASPATKVLLLAAQAQPGLVAAAIAAGADGLVTKDVSCRQVVGAIRVALTAGGP
jgi:two-component system response regulator DesR